MSQPFKTLQSLLTGGQPIRGVVVEITGDTARVATPGGLREYAATEGIVSGDEVIISAQGRMARAAAPALVYYV